MKRDEKETLIKYRLERADESIKAAKLMFDNKLYIPAMNRIYYSMFLAIPEEELVSDYILKANKFIAEISSYLKDKLKSI